MNYKNDYLFYFKIKKNKFKSNNNIKNIFTNK